MGILIDAQVMDDLGNVTMEQVNLLGIYPRAEGQDCYAVFVAQRDQGQPVVNVVWQRNIGRHSFTTQIEPYEHLVLAAREPIWDQAQWDWLALYLGSGENTYFIHPSSL